jgi:hypothetical protein
MARSPHVEHRSARPLTRLLIALLLLSPLAISVADWGRSETDRAIDAVGGPASRPAAAPEADPARPLPKPVLGFAVNAHHISDLALYLRSVDEIADLGANTLVVVTPMFQRKADSSRIRFVRSKCPTDEQLTAILRRGKEHGLRTMLMPILLIERPEEKEWRGVIAPDDWDAWWESYASFIDRFLAIAVACDVDVLSIGSELNTTESQVERWTAIVERVRARYHGLVTYSANWDRYDKAALWPLVDVMSVSSYFELERDRPGAPETDLVRAWAPVRGKLLQTARVWGKPLLLSEVGYPSLPWANAHPWNYVPQDGIKADHEAQCRSWRAFFEAWRAPLADPGSGLLGFCGYRWDPYHAGGEYDTGYGIDGKPAREVIRHGFAEIRAAAGGQ